MTTAPHTETRPRSSRSIGDLLRTLAVVGAILLVIVVINYRAPEDPVKQIDPLPMAQQVADVAGFPVLMPAEAGWRPTAVRWADSEASGAVPVWYVGGVYGTDGPYAAVVQAALATPEFIAEQTRDGTPAGDALVAGRTWQRYEADSGDRALVLADGGRTTVAIGTGSWEELQRFAGSLVEVPAA